MKLAAKILGGITFAMLIVCTVFIFIGASRIFVALNLSSDGSGDAIDTVVGGISAIFALLGFLGYVLMNALGACFILYTISFLIAYIRIYRDKSSISFNKYSGVIAGFLLFFVTIIFAFNPAGIWKVFVVTIAGAGLMITYAAIANAAQKKAFEDSERFGDGGGRYDEPPQFNFDVDMLKK